MHGVAVLWIDRKMVFVDVLPHVLVTPVDDGQQLDDALRPYGLAVLAEVIVDDRLCLLHGTLVLHHDGGAVPAPVALFSSHSDDAALIHIVRIVLVVGTAVRLLYSWKHTMLAYIPDESISIVSTPHHFGIVLADEAQRDRALEGVVEVGREVDAAALAEVIDHLRVLSSGEPYAHVKLHRFGQPCEPAYAVDGFLLHLF